MSGLFGRLLVLLLEYAELCASDVVVFEAMVDDEFAESGIDLNSRARFLEVLVVCDSPLQDLTIVRWLIFRK